MSSSAIVLNTATLGNPNGTASDFCLYALDLIGTQLYGGGWLLGSPGSPSNPDGWGLDRIYVSSSPTLDDFSAVVWTDGQSPGTWNNPAANVLYDETYDSGTNSYGLQPYYGPGTGFEGPIYYQVNDPTVVAEGSNLVMFMTAVPYRNEYPSTDPQPNDNPGYELGWLGLGWALSSDGGQSWTWEGMVPLLGADQAPLLAPVTQAFPTDPSVHYEFSTAGNELPTALNVGRDLDLWYCHRDDGGDLLLQGTPSIWLAQENDSGAWAAPRECLLVTAAGTVEINIVNPDVAEASDGSGTLWMIGQQWHGAESGDLKLFYSSIADGTNYGVLWHAWDGADGVLLETTSGDAYLGMYNLSTATILSVGNGTVDIDYSSPTTITPNGLPTYWDQIDTSFALPNATVPCFGRGTRLLTCRGEIAVEDLRVGELVPTMSGRKLARIRWIGRRRVDLRGYARPWDVNPVRVCAHAFGPGQPHRDLILSPDHAMHVDDVLIPVRYLLNGMTIAQESAAGIEYWHVELDRHAVLLAEGMAVESYLDTGNRPAFANGCPNGRDVRAGPIQAWADVCAPLVVDGPALNAVREGLLVRAAALGHDITGDPALRAVADGRELVPVCDGDVLHLALPAGTRVLELRSREAVPAFLRADSRDHRRVGVAVARIACDGQPIGLDHRRLAGGWHAPEADWRWTDGNGRIDVDGVTALTFRILPLTRYCETQRART